MVQRWRHPAWSAEFQARWSCKVGWRRVAAADGAPFRIFHRGCWVAALGHHGGLSASRNIRPQPSSLAQLAGENLLPIFEFRPRLVAGRQGFMRRSQSPATSGGFSHGWALIFLLPLCSGGTNIFHSTIKTCRMGKIRLHACLLICHPHSMPWRSGHRVPIHALKRPAWLVMILREPQQYETRNID